MRLSVYDFVLSPPFERGSDCLLRPLPQVAWAVADQLPRFRPFALPSVLASFAHLGHHPGEAWALCVLTAMRPALATTAALIGTQEAAAEGPASAAGTGMPVSEEEAAQKLLLEECPDVGGGWRGLRAEGQEGGEQLQEIAGGQLLQLPLPVASEQPQFPSGGRAAGSDSAPVVSESPPAGEREASRSRHLRRAPAPAEAMLAPVDAISMSQLLWALGKLGQQPLDASYAREVLGALSARLPDMNAQGISNSLWGESGVPMGLHKGGGDKGAGMCEICTF